MNEKKRESLPILTFLSSYSDENVDFTGLVCFLLSYKMWLNASLVHIAEQPYTVI